LPIVCLPGLTRNSRDFSVLAEALASDRDRPRTVVAMDYRGRGLSAWADPASYRPDVEAGDVIAGLDHLGIGTAAVIGTSRGGIIAMILAASAGDRLGPVVLNDIGPVVELSGLIAIRDRIKVMLADVIVTWDDAVADMKATMGRGFPAFTDAEWLDFAHQIYRSGADGRPVLDYDPALLDTFGGFDPEIGIPPFWPLFEALGARPVLAIRGENSDLLSEATITGMTERLPHMEVHRVPGQAHAPLLKDAPTLLRIKDFLNRA
jgi:pimeloyl-ACP methyl ester carboxylesterase